MGEFLGVRFGRQPVPTRPRSTKSTEVGPHADQLDTRMQGLGPQGIVPNSHPAEG